MPEKQARGGTRPDLAAPHRGCGEEATGPNPRARDGSRRRQPSPGFAQRCFAGGGELRWPEKRLWRRPAGWPPESPHRDDAGAANFKLLLSTDMAPHN